ncbi:hypothetical protein DB347_00020 [Opitutaceae bacterium EW11]|nr:hypothetical protein DB347_00020 [Opitutaceae bacterium EW11]
MSSISSVFRATAVFFLAAAATAAAKSSSWSDGKGGTFTGTPVQAVGPCAFFSVDGGARRLFFRELSLDECRRFYTDAAAASNVGPSWADAKGKFTRRLINRLAVVQDQKLVDADLKSRPEPRFVVLYCGSGWGGATYSTVWKIRHLYERLKGLYGGMFDLVFVGVRHDSKAQQGVAAATHMPWLVANYEDQKLVSEFSQYEPADGERLVLLTSGGLALFSGDIGTTQEQARFFDQLSVLLDTCSPENPQFWPDRARLLAATRPMIHARGSADPIVVNSPFDPALLRKAGIEQISAQLSVSADGKVVSATLLPATRMPELFREKAVKALVAQCVAIPALRDGKPVEGTCTFDFTVPAPNPRRELDLAWIRSVYGQPIRIPQWLLLRPIPVTEADFSTVERTDENGVQVLTKVNVGPDAVSRKTQLSAFSREFFEDAAAVAPQPGQQQVVENATYTWEAVNSTGDLVDFANDRRMEYCVGYAYAEFDVAEACPALFGLGSDDGVKIWLNGELVKNSWVRRMTQIDEDLVAVKLKPGKNRILIKIQNVEGEWSFFLRIRKQVSLAAPRT